MKISSIVEKPLSEVNKMPRFNLDKKVKRQSRILMPLVWALSYPETFKRKLKINKVNMEYVNEPFLLLCNHNSFYDFKVATRAIFPRRSTYIVAVDGFINRENLMRQVGCFGKRKFTNHLGTVRQIQYSLLKLKHVCSIYPEARYSHVGTNALLGDSLGKLIKLLKVPVVTLISHGNHLAQPVWNLRKRKVNTTADLTCILTKDEISTLTYQEINDRLEDAFKYDDYAWQKDNNIKISEPWRAEGLHLVLYKCPSCHIEGKMISHDHYLKCESCNKTWEMREDGSLSSSDGNTEFTHIPSWYEWQRDEVRKEIENGTYYFEHEVNINSLPNSTGFYQIGTGKIIHNLEGFKVVGSGFNENFEFVKNPLENYSVHVEYNYFGRGQGISFSIDNDTYYMFSTSPSYLVTKVHFAVEELYKFLKSK